jgi:hypothetical protein
MVVPMNALLRAQAKRYLPLFFRPEGLAPTLLLRSIG